MTAKPIVVYVVLQKDVSPPQNVVAVRLTRRDAQTYKSLCPHVGSFTVRRATLRIFQK